MGYLIAIVGTNRRKQRGHQTMGMIEQLKALAVDYVRTTEPFDPSRFDDLIAARTQWTPVVTGGNNIRTHALHTVSPQRVMFSATWGAWALTGPFIALGVILLAFGLWAHAAELFDRIDLGAISMFGLIFLSSGLLLHARMCSPRTFDKGLGIFWQGRFAPRHTNKPRDGASHVRLDQVYALQIIREHCAMDGGGFYSYELNLVTTDARRVHVIDHGQITVLREEAARLSAFLGDVPIWDASV